MSLDNAFRERTINELVLMFKNRQINLEPVDSTIQTNCHSGANPLKPDIANLLGLGRFYFAPTPAFHRWNEKSPSRHLTEKTNVKM